MQVYQPEIKYTPTHRKTSLWNHYYTGLNDLEQICCRRLTDRRLSSGQSVIDPGRTVPTTVACDVIKGGWHTRTPFSHYLLGIVSSGVRVGELRSHAGSAYLLIGALGSPYYLHQGGYILWSFVLPVFCLLANIT